MHVAGLRVAGLGDLLAMKLNAIAGRAQLRDYFDLMAIELQGRRSIEEGLGLFLVRYQPEHEDSALTPILLGLGHLDDIADDPFLPVERDAIVTYWEQRQPEIVLASSASASTDPRRWNRHSVSRPAWSPTSSPGESGPVPGGRSCRPLEIRVDERNGFVLVARHQVPVAIECDLDRAVAEVGGESLRVHARCDQDRREGVARLMEADWRELGLLPRLVRATDERVAVEGPRPASEEKSAAASAPELPRGEVRAKGGDDGDRAAAGAALPFDEPVAAVPGALDANDAGFQVDVFVAESPELAEAPPS